MSTELAGKVAVVTGGARGIGRACALRLASLGAKVAVVDRNLAGAAEFGEQLGADSVEDELRALAGDAAAYQADLGSGGGADAVMEAVRQNWGRLDVLVTAAGGGITPYERSRASDTTDEDLAVQLQANLWSMITSCRAAVPLMRDSGGGSIVTIGSTAGFALAMPDGHVAAYGAAKAGVHHFTRYLAADVGRWNIRVNCIAPGVIATARLNAQSVSHGLTDDVASSIPLGRRGTPEDIADAVQYFATPLSAYVSGQLLPVNGGSH
ncbi:MAG: SDR family oxidoreductase [Actinomycetota bacterium]|nr:MAG: SDR family oxidoreductase [Actinomycetota bacterium]